MRTSELGSWHGKLRQQEELGAICVQEPMGGLRTEVVEWEDMEFTIDGLSAQYQQEDPFVWYLTESLAASRKKGKVVVKKTRLHPIVRHLDFERV
jgi:hypothetical protein